MLTRTGDLTAGLERNPELDSTQGGRNQDSEGVLSTVSDDVLIPVVSFH